MQTPNARSDWTEFITSIEHGPEPLAVIPFHREGPKIQGCLWVQGGSAYATSDLRNLKVYVRGMLVCDNERDLLPEWAGFISGMIETTHLTPTASRESLQKNGFYYEIRTALREILVEGFDFLASKNPAVWRRMLRRHNEALLGSAVADQRVFDMIHDQLQVGTTEGDMTISTLFKRSPKGVYVEIGDESFSESVLYRAQRLPVVYGRRFAALEFVQKCCDQKLHKVWILGASNSIESLFPSQEIQEDDRLRLEECFQTEGFTIRFTKLEIDYIPILIASNQDAILRRHFEEDDADKRFGSSMLQMVKLYTNQLDSGEPAFLNINLNSRLIQEILTAPLSRARSVANLLTTMSMAMCEQNEGMPFDKVAALENYYQHLQSLLLDRLEPSE
jgi:molecular chaperone HtpG